MVGTITVINGYKEGFDIGIYIGRGGKGKANSPFANPYTVKDYGRELCLKKYAEWLDKKLKDKNSPQRVQFDTMINLLREGHDIKLVCFCAPKPCHGDILKNRLEENISEPNLLRFN